MGFNYKLFILFFKVGLRGKQRDFEHKLDIKLLKLFNKKMAEKGWLEKKKF